LPSMRNSFGSRTAWLRPCLKSLAVARSDIGRPNGIYHWYIPLARRLQCRGRARRRMK
jgi:hypothetical protein